MPVKIFRAEAAVGMAADRLLADAGIGSLRRWMPGTAGLKFVHSLATKPRVVAGRGAQTAAELARVAAGTSVVMPERGDGRFADAAWTTNPLLRRVMHAYLVAGRATTALVADAQLDWRADERMRFLTDNLVEAVSPSNHPILNPVALKAAIDTGGLNFIRGAKALARDMSSAPRLPRMVEPNAFEVGKDLAVTPGTVVLRTEQFELLQYAPQTNEVRQVPLLVIPALINKYYATDLAPGRSLIEHLVKSGQQVFVMSWRNPDARHRDWGVDSYAQAVLDALSAVERICDVDATMVCGFCSGGILAALVAAHLAATESLERIAGLTLPVTLIDQSRAGGLIDPSTARIAAVISARRGYLPGPALAEAFAWLRPGDLIWRYWVNNYLLGRTPPPFDILFWNADSTGMPAALHREFLELGISNKIAMGEANVLGSSVDLSKITVDAYLVAAIADHLCKWESCYATTALLGGKSRFVLSTSGHIAAIINPPGNEKATFRVGEENPSDPSAWLAAAKSHKGSWWDDYVAWLDQRCGPLVPRPEQAGGDGLEPIGAAPGSYIFDR
jgi:polyhydroxyalkanoate synthase